jgi:peroxiredoxin
MINIGDKIPTITLKTLTEDGIEDFDLNEHLKGKKIVIFGVPGAFTPTCTFEHLPSFIKRSAAIKEKGVDEILCIGVNDPLVMDAWGKAVQIEGKITLLSDWDASFSTALGVTFDGSAIGLGIRSRRYNAIVEDGILKYIELEEDPGSCGITHADQILEHL